MQKSNHFIITTQPGAADTAVGELQKIFGSGVRTVKVFSPEARLINIPDVPGDPVSPVEIICRKTAFVPYWNRLIFTRHLFPVHYTGEISSPEWTEVLPSAKSKFSGYAFSVQLRVMQRDDELFTQGRAVINAAADKLTAYGFKQDDKNPEWVLSLLIDKRTLYAGVSWSADNLSHWNGGETRFKKDDDFISRAEFKLLEAFEVFGIKTGREAVAQDVNGLTVNGGSYKKEAATAGAADALDLGAAPGGWTKALLSMGYTVTAVDPAEMHPGLSNCPRLTHIKTAAQHCRFKDASFDLIVNDMRMDIYESARIMLDFAHLLRPVASALMTLKLPQGHWLQKTAGVLKLLEEKYSIINARQLFHNRNEVTVLMAPR